MYGTTWDGLYDWWIVSSHIALADFIFGLLAMVATLFPVVHTIWLLRKRGKLAKKGTVRHDWYEMDEEGQPRLPPSSPPKAVD